MPRRNLPVEVRETENPNVPAIVQDSLDFRPTDSMLKLRAEFFALEEENPLDLRDIREKIQDYFPQARAEQILRLMDNNPAFGNWFQGAHEFRARVKYLADKALNALESILNDPNPMAANAKVKAAQMILDMAGKSAKEKDKEEKKSGGLADALSKMNRAQVEALMQNGTQISVSVKNPDVLDVNKE